MDDAFSGSVNLAASTVSLNSASGGAGGNGGRTNEGQDGPSGDGGDGDGGGLFFSRGALTLSASTVLTANSAAGSPVLQYDFSNLRLW